MALATTTACRDTSTGATATKGDGKTTAAAAAATGSHGSDTARLMTMTTTTSSAGFPDEDEDDDDELFELDIARLDGLGDERRHRHVRSAAAEDDGGGADHDGHALLANCLLPLRCVSQAVPVDAGCSSAPWSWTSTSYPYSGYYSARRLVVCTGSGASSRRFLSSFLGGRPGTTGSSARFCFSSRGFETMGNYYFQRY